MLIFRNAAVIISTLILAACQPSATASVPAAGAPSAGTPFPSAVPPTGTSQPLVASATATLAPAPRDFSEDFEGALPYWSFLQVDNGQTIPASRVDGGFLRFDLPQPNQWAYAFYHAVGYADVRIDARVDVEASGQGAAGLACRYSRELGWYEFNIYADQTYALLYGQWLSEGIARYTPLVRSASEKIQAGKNEIGLLCQGDILTPFINGTQLARRQDKAFGLTHGQIGISASSFEAVPLLISYDWVKVSEP